jgi:hypothetical protein
MLTYFAAAALCVASANAHGHMSSPRGRSPGVNGDGQAFANCRDQGTVGPPTAVWQEGQEIEVDIFISAFHKGWHELRFCEDPYGNNTCFESTPGAIYVSGTGSPAEQEGCPEPAPSGSTYARAEPACIPSPKENRELLFSAGGKSQWRLPAGVSCEHCAMQWWWTTDNFAYEHFKSCKPSSQSLSPTPPMPEQSPLRFFFLQFKPVLC